MLAYLQAERHKRSHGRDLGCASHLKPYFRGKDMTQLRAADIRGYIEHRRDTVAPATINRELCLLSAAINYARREWEWDIPNPVSGRKLKEPEGRVRWITRGDAEALIRGIKKSQSYLVDFIRLALHTGCRKQELLGLEWSRVDLKENLFLLEAAHTKTARRRSIPLNTAARAAILNRARFRSEHCPASPWVFAHKDGTRILDLKNSFASACKNAGIKDFRIHDLRHTCAAWLVSRGVPLSEVKELLGHSTINMTERYAHLAPENVRAAVAVLDGESRFSHGAQKDDATPVEGTSPSA
ncbi:MAG: site-specific integrase [Gammaproteobacteria bacterium]|nr:site-specific integrase [Gammaproteobacteria bacterium]